MRFGTLFVLSIVAGMNIGCSDVGFQSVPSPTCTNFDQGRDQECRFTPEGNFFSVTFRTGQLDVLVVNDNSGSMSREQERMADAFGSFLNQIDDFDYRITMVTTDMENDNGALLTFIDEDGVSSGDKILRKGDDNILSKFRGTVQRQETLTCDENRYEAEFCPSSDERGIYAATTAINNNQGGWLRSGAHTAIIALSDESQRSITEWDETLGDWVGGLASRPLESVDRPESLVSSFGSKYATKSLAVHPIVIRPGDSSCLAQQISYFDLSGSPLAFPLVGQYANLWAELADPEATGLEALANIVPGSLGSICANNYYNELNVIGSFAASDASRNEVQMQCLPNPEDIDVVSDVDVEFSLDEENQRIIFEDLPIGIEVRVTWVCDNNI